MSRSGGAVIAALHHVGFYRLVDDRQALRARRELLPGGGLVDFAAVAPVYHEALRAEDKRLHVNSGRMRHIVALPSAALLLSPPNKIL